MVLSTKRRPSPILGLLALSFAVAGCEAVSGLNPWAGSENAPNVSDALVQADAMPEALAEMHEAYRLAPDRRFLSAIAAVDAMCGVAAEEGKGQVKTVPDGSGWRVELDGHVLGSLPTYPDFLELYGLVVARAEASVRSGACTVAPAPTKRSQALEREKKVPLPGSIRQARSVLEKVEAARAGGSLDAAQLVDGARAWLVYELSLNDTMQVGDDISSHAIAALALAEAGVKRELRSDRALLARHLGYGETAAVLAGPLAEGDPVRHYARSEVPELAKAARRGGAPITWLYLDLSRRTGHDDRLRHTSKSISPAAARTVASVAHLSKARWGDAPRMAYLARTMVELELASGARTNWKISLLDTLDEARRLHSVIGTSPDRVVPTAERLISRMEHDDAGAYFSGAVEAKWHEAHLLSAIAELSRFYRDALASDQAAQAFAASVGTASRPSLREGIDVQRVLIDAKGMRGDPRLATRLGGKIAGLQEVGATGRKLLFDAANDADPFNLAVYRAAQSWVAAADTRPVHRDDLRHIATDTLLDLPLAENLGRAVVRDAPNDHVYTDLWLRQIDDDLPAIEAMARDERLSPRHRGVVATALSRRKEVDDATTVAAFEAAIQGAPRSWDPVDDYDEWLFHQARYADAKRVVEAWVKRPHDPGKLDELHAHNALARAQYYLGEYDACWARMSQVARSLQYGNLYWAALCGEKAGAGSDAMAIAKIAQKRYPGSSTAILPEVRLSWSRGDDAGAAAKLVGANPPLSTHQWFDDVSDTIHHAFPKGHEARAQKALDALFVAGMQPRHAEKLANGLRLWERPDLGVYVGERIQLGGLEGIDLATTVYIWKKRHEGDAAAYTWLEGRYPPGIGRQPFSQFGFARRQCELPWAFVEDPPEGDPHGGYIWLVRTACAIDPAGRDHPDWKTKAEAYYQAHGTQEFYDHVALMLLGKQGPAEVWAMAGDADQKTEAAYFIAVRALAQGEVERAIDWFRITVEIGDDKEGESHWALQHLYDWRNEMVSVERLRERYAARQPVVAP